MGQVGSRLEDSPQIYVRDQSRFSLQSIRVLDVQENEVLSVEFKETSSGIRAVASNDSKRPLEFIQDPERVTSETLELLLKLKRYDELTFHFTGQIMNGQPNGQTDAKSPLTGLTFIHTSSLKDAKKLLTTDFHADPNLQKHKNVTYVGDYQTSSPFDWKWTWTPPAETPSIPPTNHRSSCCFVEYSQRDNSFLMLAYLSFAVEDIPITLSPGSPQRRSSAFSSVDSRLESVSENPELTITLLPGEPPREGSKSPTLPPQADPSTQLSNPRADELLLKDVEDGPLFRSRITTLEKKTSTLKAKTKKIITRAEELLDAQNGLFEADRRWYDSLQQLSGTNSKAIQPLLANYLEASFAQSQRYYRRRVAHLQILINELRRIYDYDIKAAEAKKRTFDEDSQDYYHSMTKYLAKNDFPSASKQKEKDNKIQSRRKDYDLKRFDYWSFMNDLNGGRKEQEILHHLTQYMDSQLTTLMDVAKAERDLKPGLDGLLQQVEETSREFKLVRTEREQRRRDLEMGKNIGEGLQVDTNAAQSFAEGALASMENVFTDTVTSPNTSGPSVVRGQWLSDVEDEDKIDIGRRKKEGILYALSRPANHNDPKVIPKTTWHKYWVVLDKGQLWEYTNWKRSSELHNDSIHLNAATVREAQNVDRRFCFEVVTPKFKRVYQAMSNEDMESWIQAIRNAIQSALDGSATTLDLLPAKSPPQNIKRHPVGDMFSKGGKDRRTFSGSQESRELLTGSTDKTTASNASVPSPLATVRAVDPSNSVCADCGNTVKVEWCSINLAVIICIECSGIHRSLGSHISKMRSLTLDTTSFTPNLLNILSLLPNSISNSIWEHTSNPAYPKPTPQSSYDFRHAYITAKYVNRAFVEPTPPSTSANELLVRSILNNDLKGVLWALALKADPNTRTPVLPAVVVALQQDDKQGTSLGKTDSGSSSSSGTHEAPKYPFAELLVLNGATPVDPRTLPSEANNLSESAKRYLHVKSDRLLHHSTSPQPQFAVPTKTTSGGSTHTPSASIAGDLNRTVSKLQKRLSSGGKNLRTHIQSAD